MKEVVSITPSNLGWIESTLDSKQMDFLWKCIDNKKGDHRSELAGNISASYVMEDKDGWFTTNVLSILSEEYMKNFGNIASRIPTTQAHPFILSSLWVNYQKQGEFNPMHNHNGVFSFVIWMKIPFDYKDQLDLPNCKGSNTPLNSVFQFYYSDICGQFRKYTYPLSRKDEGRIVFFPSSISHQVYPFYNCDEDRISISGNIQMDSSTII